MRGSFLKYVVQTQYAIEQFNDIEMARKYAEHARYAAIWKGEDVIEIQGTTITCHKDCERPKWRYW